MKRIQLASQSLRAVGFDESRRMLEVEFTSGAIYEYQDVSLRDVTALMLAESRGDHFDRIFRPGHPRYRRLA